MTNATWPQHLRRGLVSLEQLAEKGWLSKSDARADLERAQEALDIRVPEAFHAGIASGDLGLALQVIPSGEEAFIAEEELADPIGDEVFSPVAGLTHRYPDRVLVKITYQCAMYCRFCFRRHKVSHSEENLSYEALEEAYRYIEDHPEIREVIFTGGDPLVLTDARLEPHLARVEGIPHIETIRFHTRVPTALPERITASLSERLTSSSKGIWILVHINSSSELTPSACEAIKRLKRAGVSIASQSVLLRGVNASEESLEALLRALYRLGVQPFYLHYPDLAKGTSHFRIPLSEALRLVSRLSGRLPGIAIPRLTVDIPGGYGKVTLQPETFRQVDETSWEFRSPLTGSWHRATYPQS
jgi:lysine 2,3-aminomutase